MRRITIGEGWLGANMVIMVLDRIPLNQVVLTGKVHGDAFTKDEEDFNIIFSSRLVSVLLDFFARSLVSGGSSMRSLPRSLCACCE